MHLVHGPSPVCQVHISNYPLWRGGVIGATMIDAVELFSMVVQLAVVFHVVVDAHDVPPEGVIELGIQILEQIKRTYVVKYDSNELPPYE